MNEYLRRYLDELGGPFGFTVPFDPARFEREIEATRVRIAWTAEYAWAIPSEEALDLLAGEGRIVEVGAGGGYWAFCLRERGVDVVAVDANPSGRSVTEVALQFDRRRWTHVDVGGPEVAGDHPDRTLFLCWPPLGFSMARDSLEVHRAAGGRRLAYVGEPYGGCCADDAFHELVARSMVEVASAPMPTWPGMHDHVLTIFETKENA